jgi:inner membrane protein
LEPVTHFLTGACLGRAGLNRKTAYATLAMTLAAEAPDLDVLWGLRGPVAGMEHHRGLSHTLLGAPFVALAVTGAVWLLDRWIFRRRGRGPNEQPVRWLLVWLFSWIAVLSHILLDWTNNYGVRPFFPFNPRWYSLDIVFIFEPVLFAVLLAALIMPGLLGMADREIGAKRQPFRGRGWAIAALLIAVALWGLRWSEHRQALRLTADAQAEGEPAIRIAAEPYPINPFHWLLVVETRNSYLLGSANTLVGRVDLGDESNRIFKPPVTPAVAAAKQSWLGRVYLDWAGFPVVTDLGPAGLTSAGGQAPNARDSVVEFRDLRFAYPTLLQGQSKNNSPLNAWVYVTPEGAIDAMAVGHRLQK